MAQNLSIYIENNINIFKLSGELDETNSVEVFNKIYDTIGVFTKETKIIFHLKNLEYINSKSIGYIADIISNTKENGGSIFLSECNTGIQDTLELVGINKMVDIVDTNEEAISDML